MIRLFRPTRPRKHLQPFASSLQSSHWNRNLATHMSPLPMASSNVNWVPSQLDSDPSSSYSTFPRSVIQSPHDDRSYRIIRLHNDLQAIIVSDPTTDKAAASLSVGVGHLSDPDDRPGLAHFCEHLLFMVRKKRFDSERKRVTKFCLRVLCHW